MYLQAVNYTFPKLRLKTSGSDQTCKNKDKVLIQSQSKIINFPYTLAACRKLQQIHNIPIPKNGILVKFSTHFVCTSTLLTKTGLNIHILSLRDFKNHRNDRFAPMELKKVTLHLSACVTIKIFFPKWYDANRYLCTTEKSNNVALQNFSGQKHKQV